MNQTKNRRNGRIVLAALGCAALLVPLVTPVTLAQSEADSTVPPSDAEAIEAAVQALPLSSSTVLDVLSETARAEVERICLPVQFHSGSVAYRECISEQLDSQSTKSTSAVSATALSFDEEYAVQQACQGAGAVDSAGYRACDEEQLASLVGVPEPALGQISEDETYAVQLDCYDIQTRDGVRAYRKCLNETIGQLLALPRPDLSILALVDKNAVQLRCSAQNDSAVAYRNCLLDAVDGGTRADQTIDSPLVENESEFSVEPSDQTATGAALLVLPENSDTTDDSQPAPLADSETKEVAVPVVEVIPAETPQAIQLPTTDARNQADTTDEIGVQPETSEEAEVPGQSPAELLLRVQSTVASMSDMTRMLMWTAIALPILLTLLWLILRGRKPATASVSSYSQSPISKGVDTTPHRPSPSHRLRLEDDDTMEFAQPSPAPRRQKNLSTSVNDEEELNFSAQMDELFGGHDTEGATHSTEEDDPDLDISSNSTLRVVPAQESESPPESASTPDTGASVTTQAALSTGTAAIAIAEQPPLIDSTLTPATERDDYLAWLSVQDEAKQQTLAIEFLIYWMAYSDERYPPELKNKIFQLQNPGDHDLIKRWSLRQDVHAFAGNLQWLQYNLSTEQHEQIINLLMALLVSENALTPAQNTLLRFLADAFGLSVKWLDEMFQKGFAHPMPKLPRLDNPDWWRSQSPDSLKRWDARSVSRQRSDIRYRVSLGLPLGGELNPEAIMASFRRAAKRCQPARFDRLSLREQTLVAKQLEKYETAAESLLEVSA